MKSKWMVWGALAALGMALAGCGGGDGGDPVPRAPEKSAHPAVAAPAVAPAAYALKAATPVAGDIVANGSFESGVSGWTISADAGTTVVGSFPQISANTGSQLAWLGGGDNVTNRLSQRVTVPAGGQQARLQFWFRIASNDSEITEYDSLAVELYSNAGARLATLATYSNLDRTSGWVQSPALDLTAYRGQSVELRFTAETDVSESTSFFIDDVAVFPQSTGSITPTTGVWWNPSESGSGYVLDRFGAQVYLSAYMYEESGSSTWYTALLSPQADGSYTGAFTRYSGGQTLQGAYRAPTGTTEVAQVSLAFSSATQATLRVQKSGGGAARSTAIQLFTLGSAASAASFQPGVWWNDAESGRGFVLQVYGSTVTMSSFMFDDGGQPVWYLGTAQLSGANSFSMQLQQYGGGQWLAGAYRAATVRNANAGRMDFTATSATTGRLTLPNGRVIDVKKFDLGGGGGGSGGGSNPAPGGGGGTGSSYAGQYTVSGGGVSVNFTVAADGSVSSCTAGVIVVCSGSVSSTGQLRIEGNDGETPVDTRVTLTGQVSSTGAVTGSFSGSSASEGPLSGSFSGSRTSGGGGTGGGGTGGGGNTGGGGGGSPGAGCTGGIATTGSPLEMVVIDAIPTHVSDQYDRCAQSWQVTGLPLRFSIVNKGYPASMGGGFDGGFIVAENMSSETIEFYWLFTYADGTKDYQQVFVLGNKISSAYCGDCTPLDNHARSIRAIQLEHRPGATLRQRYLAR